MILHKIHRSAAVLVDPFSTIGIGLPDWLGLNMYDVAYMRLKKIAIVAPPTKRRGYDDYYLIAVFDIKGRGWHMLATADLYPYVRRRCVPSSTHLRGDKPGDLFHLVAILWYGRLQTNAQTIICIPNGTPLFCRDQSSPDQNKIADPGSAFASAIRSNLEPCS